MNKSKQPRSSYSAVMGLIFLPVLLSIAAPQQLRAAAYYVAKTGSDANPGSTASPFLTIGKGIGALRPGDTLFIRGGTYAESFGDAIPSGASWSSPTTLTAYPGEIVTIRPPSGASRVVSFTSSRYIVLDGFVMDGANMSSDGIKISHAGSNTAEYIRVKNTELKNAPAMGILVSGASRGNEFINMKVHDNGGTRGDLNHGFYIEGANNLVEYCDIYNNTGKGVQIYKEGGGPVDNNIVRYNKIHDNAKPGPRGVGIILSTGRGNKAHDNLIWNNSGGIQVDYGSNGAMIFNNTIYSNNGPAAQYGISLSGSGTNTVVRNNIVFQNSGGNITGSQSGQILSNNLTSDPLFVNAAGLDFRLKSGSPAIDRGMDLSAQGVTVDLAGTPRPLGAAYDIGAYEYAGVIPPPVVDTTAPVISAVAASAVSLSGATIGWTTNEAADTQVEYGATTAYGASTPLTATLSIAHSAVLSGLAAGTLYHYRVRSKDAAGNLAVSGDNVLTTVVAPDTAAPLISAVAASAVSQSGATIGWTTDEAADTQAEYGPTTAYGASSVLNSALATSHSAALSGLTAGTLYHYRVRSKDAAGNLAMSPDATFVTSFPVAGAVCINSAGSWANMAVAAQAGTFTAEFDAVPSAPNIDGVAGLSNGAASDYGRLAAAVRFNNSGRIDARNGGAFAAAAAIPYAAGLTYRFRLAVNVPARTYSAYVKQGANAEQLIGGGYAFRTEQAAVTTLNNVGLFASAGSEQVCGVAVSGALTDTVAPVIGAVAASAVSQTGATIGWTTNEAADTQVEYGPTTAYGASTPLTATLSIAHSAALSGLTAGTLYHYRVRSRDAAGNLAMSADATFATAAPIPAVVCINSAGSWANVALTPQSGTFTVEYDAVPGAANIDGVAGLSNGAAASYNSLAAIVRFNNAGRIDARNGGVYAAASPIPYAAGLTYRFRLVVNVPGHTYSAYVKQGANAEQLIGGNYAFRTEQAAVSTLSSLGLISSSGSQSVCNAVLK